MRQAVATLAVAVIAFCAACIVDAPTAAPSAPAPTVRLRFRLGDTPSDFVAARFHPEHVFAPEAAVRTGDEDAVDLNRWYFVDVAEADVKRIADQLLVLGASNFDIEPEFVPAIAELDDDARLAVSDACPIKTPPYDARQAYLPAMDARVAWNVAGGRGQGVRVADVEGDWNDQHEDLPPLTHVAGRKQGRGWSEHGTAVLGVVAAKDNGIGMVGIAPGVDGIVTASLGGIGAARALQAAANALSPGDILIVELHGPGPNSRGRGQQGYVPMEWWQPEFDVIKAATRRGIIVVEAAGNGSEDLDAPIYKKKFDRSVRDSGAILVGAGASTVDESQPPRSRLFFSNYGSRVDVQGWGYHVATLDYGDLQGCASASRKYTARFSGTSSASPVVAGAIAIIQGVNKAQSAPALTSQQMRKLLTSTGMAQTESPRAPASQHIGPLPQVAYALEALDRDGAPFIPTVPRVFTR